MRISTVVFVLKGGKYSLRYLSEKYEIYRRTKKSCMKFCKCFTVDSVYLKKN
jgi:hypothetical protein